MGQGYAGDVTPKTAWDILKTKDDSYLVDCRTTAEWNFVGVPDLSQLNKEAALLEGTRFPDGSPNPDFVNQVEQIFPHRDAPILFLCRSGQRSIGAATAMTEVGYPNCYNVLEGFEGNANRENHRTSSDGWKFAGLPWQQS